MRIKLDMHNNLDSLILTAFTLYLYVAKMYILPSLIDVPITPVFLRIVNDGIIGFFVLVSAISTALLNAYKFWLTYKDRQKRQHDKTETPLQQTEKENNL